MPVNIYRVTEDGEKNETIARLCDGEWLLTPQSEALSAWLLTDAGKMPPSEYVANISFSWRRDALSGGPAFSPEILRRMADLGISLLYLNTPDSQTKWITPPANTQCVASFPGTG